MTGDPATQEWHQALGESTSARLRRVEAELGSALSALADAREQIARLTTRLEHATGGGRCAWRELAEQLMRERHAKETP